MPAQNLSRTNADDIYCHIYNRGIEHKTIFNDTQDYQVFLGYLQDYLSTPADPETTKKTFSIKGRVFRGTPHQSKNYFNQVELLAYSLLPSQFHLLVHQITKDAVEGLIRSLCTRYSMYFNKKYQRSGSLFHGPYKSVLIEDETLLLRLTRYFHTSSYSSYPEYLGTRITPWVKPTAVPGDYKDFVEKYEPSQKEKETFGEITLGSDSQHLERRNPASNVRPSELLAIGTIFLLLLALGLRNIMSSPTPQVLSNAVEIKPTTADPTPTVEPSPTPENPGGNTGSGNPMLTIKITDGSASVNIRQEPSVGSNKIGSAKDSDIFEFVSLDSGWYEIKLSDESTGFISARYIQVIEQTYN
ncbi:MAG: putative transposase [Microgenomates group bacterium Gr01-1014_16]|nr:MAG: putative transposase [Microgenomates group bacterium Gr01-1014_16]